MKAKIWVDKDAAVIAGVNNYGWYFVEFDPAEFTPEQREELIKSKQDDNAYLINRGVYDSYGSSVDIMKTAIADFETMKKMLDLRISIKAERKIKWDMKAKEKDERDRMEGVEYLKGWMSIPLGERVIHKRGTYSPMLYEVKLDSPTYNKYHQEVPGITEALELAEAECTRKNAESKKQFEQAEREAIERKEREAAAKRQKKQDVEAQIAKWVEDYGTLSQVERLAAKLLHQQEIIDAIRNQAYRKLDELPQYVKMKPKDVCACEYGTCNVTFDVIEKSWATEEEFSLMSKIKNLLPGAELELREHYGHADECENTATRIGIMVRLTVGALSFSREYAI